MTRTLVILSTLALATPLSAAPEALTHEQAMKRMEGCLSTGAPGAPRTGLRAAIVALRSLCAPQIHRVRDLRLAEIDARYGLPEARLTEAQEVERHAAHEAAERRLDDEVAFAIANYTGLTQ
ncbi:hypothetical protein [Pelagerythrobacter sp.]|uniref:hypothetical protein n=1 Tax=Pelagerythrobacter sp. TaxID=2800702 RepID=UPI0035AE3559